MGTENKHHSILLGIMFSGKSCLANTIISQDKLKPELQVPQLFFYSHDTKHYGRFAHMSLFLCTIFQGSVLNLHFYQFCKCLF